MSDTPYWYSACSSKKPRQDLELMNDARRLNHCAIAVSDWLAGGCEIHDIPRPEIAVLVAFCKEVVSGLPLRGDVHGSH